MPPASRVGVQGLASHIKRALALWAPAARLICAESRGSTVGRQGWSRVIQMQRQRLRVARWGQAPAGRHTCLQVSPAAAAGAGPPTSPQLLLPAVETREGREDTYTGSFKVMQVRGFALGAQFLKKFLTDAAAAAKMNL